MNWLSKVKSFLGKVRDVLNTDVKDLFKKPTVVIDKTVATSQSTLERLVRSARALSPIDLQPRTQAKAAPSCTHVYTILKQVWIRVEAKKFELRNEMVCAKCKEHKIVPIG